MVSISNVLRNPISGLTHFIGAGAAVLGIVHLLLRADDALHMVAFGIYGATLLALYVSSTLYHWLLLGPAGISRLRRVDHLMIFSFIAGTYTPVALLVFDGVLRWTLLGLIWGIAAAGWIVKLAWMHAPRPVYVGIYIGMGWVALFFAVPLVQAMNPPQLALLIAGGLFYTVGAVCYTRKSPDPFPGVFGFHEIWHLFVMAGSAAHYFMVRTL